MSERFQGRACARGGIVGYPSNQLHEEVAYIAFHFHWTLEEILSLDHLNRRRWVTEIGKLRQSI
jgi:hypothetical protein